MTVLSLAASLALGCEPSGRSSPIARPDGGSLAYDTDFDWLCDDTELRIGTDPELADSDGDRLPDGLELQYGLGPLDQLSPGLTAIPTLAAEPGGTAEVEVFAVVEGAGEAFSGELQAWPGLDPAWPMADHYFTGAVVSSAEPPDRVYGVSDDGDRIGSVLGQARLGFRVRFAYLEDVPAECAQAVPFSYAVKRQDGTRFGDSYGVLIVAPDADSIAWCRTDTCW